MSNRIRIIRAVLNLQRGRIIAYPTEAVYGLGCDPDNGAAVSRLLKIKRRPVHKGLILIAADFAQVQRYVKPLPPEKNAEICATWPGPVTWLLPAKPFTSRRLRGQHNTLAVRITAHPLAAALCKAWGGALVSTSANRSGSAPARTAFAVRRTFRRQVNYILNGNTGGAAKPSQIRDVRSGRVLR